jgi:hypothetical protein
MKFDVGLDEGLIGDMSCLISGFCRLNRSLIILPEDVDVQFVTRMLHHASQQSWTSYKHPHHSIRGRKQLIQGRECLGRINEDVSRNRESGLVLTMKSISLTPSTMKSTSIIRSVLRDTNRRSSSPQPVNTNAARLKPPFHQEVDAPHFHERAPKSPTSR